MDIMKSKRQQKLFKTFLRLWRLWLQRDRGAGEMPDREKGFRRQECDIQRKREDEMQRAGEEKERPKERKRKVLSCDDVRDEYSDEILVIL